MKTNNTRGMTNMRTLSIIIISTLLCSSLLSPLIIRNAKASSGIGYWVIVEGANFHNLQYAIKYGCTQVHNILKGMGYSYERIRYVAVATKVTFKEAIIWAGSRVTSSEPLWIYMFDHGADNWFGFRGGTHITYTEVNEYLESYIPSNVDVHVIVAACHSGSAIPELSNVRVRISSCASAQSSYLYDPNGLPNWEAFSVPFWEKIKDYETVGTAFDYACSHIKNVQGISNQDPQLDDDGNSDGHTGPLPNGGDGYVADNLYIGSHAYRSVGGITLPVDKPVLLAPYIALAVSMVTMAIGIWYTRKQWLGKIV